MNLVSRDAHGDASVTAASVAAAGDQVFASAAARAQPIAAAVAAGPAPGWFVPAITAALAIAAAPGGAIHTAVQNVLAVATAPGGSIHTLVTVSAHNSVARSQNGPRAGLAAALVPLQDAQLCTRLPCHRGRAAAAHWSTAGDVADVLRAGCSWRRECDCCPGCPACSVQAVHWTYEGSVAPASPATCRRARRRGLPARCFDHT